MSNRAKEIIVPSEPHIFRAVFLYVGQGESTLLVIPDAENYKYALIDSNYDEDAGGIDIIKLLKDLFDGQNKGLDVYINTHPHKDHLGKVKEIYEKIGINQLWHSGHKPGGEHKEIYENLVFVIKELSEENVFLLRGSREENKLDEQEIELGDIDYNILAPADYVSDEIEGEKPEERYARIHEQCGVIRFKYGDEEKQILITGDADYKAWKEHITDYHEDRLLSTVLSAAHHGSKSFFWKDADTDEDPYKS
jgi:competence protein ComEC